MDTSGFSVEKSAAEWNVLLYLYRFGVGFKTTESSQKR